MTSCLNITFCFSMNISEIVVYHLNGIMCPPKSVMLVQNTVFTYECKSNKQMVLRLWSYKMYVSAQWRIFPLSDGPPSAISAEAIWNCLSLESLLLENNKTDLYLKSKKLLVTMLQYPLLILLMTFHKTVWSSRMNNF